MSTIQIQDILDLVQKNQPDADISTIQKAYVFAAAAHAGQTRLNGEPYLSHPLAVAHTLAQMRLDDGSIIAALLHDCVEDCSVDIEDIDSLFGEDVANIVDGVSKISLMDFGSKEAQQAENIRKMILAMSEDIRVLIVKLADRLHNMRTLNFQKSHKQVRISQETMDIYAPLASRLGLHRVKLELEDLSFQYIKPDAHQHIQEWLDQHKTTDTTHIENIIGILKKMLKENTIKGVVKGRIKNTYSIWRKMTAQNLSLEDMHDIIAFRIIVDNLKDCYAALGLAHALWIPVPGRFKDYISMPKGNMYQSLHTTVIGPKGERMEIQIRTEEMDRLAEHGLASHWLYKESKRLRAKDVRQFAWLREMLDWQKGESDSKEFLRTLRFDLFKDEIFVFTPQGDVKELPEGASPIDFAYLVHSEVGNHCAGAKVNGKLVPLSTPLKSGDTIEIITAAQHRPNRDWLRIVKTGKAKTHIQSFIRTEERSRSITLGKEMLEKQGRRLGINLQKLHKDGGLDTIVQEFKLHNIEELFSAVGYAKLTPRKVFRSLLPKTEKTSAAAEIAAEQNIDPRKDAVNISGMDNMLVTFAKCCNPVPGDAVIGFISRGRGVVVHTANCPSVTNTDEPERLLSVSWDGAEQSLPFPARIHLLSENKKGMLAKVAVLLSEQNINIADGKIHSLVDGHTEIDLTIEVTDSAHLYMSMGLLRKVPGIVSVQRRAAVFKKEEQ